MKKLCVFVVTATILLIGCRTEPLINEEETIKKSSENVFEVPMSKISAFAISYFDVSDYLNDYTQRKKSLKNARLSADGEVPLFSKDHEIDKIDVLKGKAGEELLYVINFRAKNANESAKKGFVIMSADRRAIPVLAWSNEDSFTLEGEMPPSVEMWLGYAKEVVQRAKKEKEPSKEALVAWRKLDEYTPKKNGRVAECTHPNPWICGICDPGYNITVGPVIDPISRWGQGRGYNNSMWNRDCGQCERANVGCGGVALGMIMRFDQRPATGYNFGIMPRMVAWNCTGLTAGEQEVARLLYNVSASMNSSNTLGCATFTLPHNIQDGFSWAGYSQVGYSTSDMGLMYNEVMFGRPVLMSGTTGPVNLNNAHYWVCDGVISTMYCVLADYNNPDPQTCICGGNIAYHMNWGWGGNWNGWFSLGNLRPDPNSSDVYNNWLRARVNVRP